MWVWFSLHTPFGRLGHNMLKGLLFIYWISLLMLIGKTWSSYNIFLQAILLRMPIFGPKFNFFEVSLLYMVEHPEMVMTLIFFICFYLKGPKYWKIYAWTSCATKNHNMRSNHVSDQEENRPIFFPKKWGSVFLNFLIQALLRPQIAIRQHVNISRVIIHIRIVLNNAKYLITWSNFVGFGN